MLVAGSFLWAASGKMFIRYATHHAKKPVEVSYTSTKVHQPSAQQDRRMVDMTADDSYLIEKGDSTIFILVGHFAAHHNGAVILADSAVRYSNQSFECFGNVLINQNSTYIYGERAEYNRMNNTAKVFSRLIKVVDEDAVIYTYDCEFNTAKSEGIFSGGCYAEKGESLLEADRGFYNTKTHELKAVDRVQMRNETYEVLSDSVIFNTQTEDAQYFTNTHIWNDKEEYLYADAGTYTKRSDLHHLTRHAYILSPEREIWSDTVMYYRTDGHIIARRNIQVDDTTQKVLGFADYAEWWDMPGNAFFTRRPSMINYDPELTDSIYLSADTLWMYTIPVRPEEKLDSLADSSNTQPQDSTSVAKGRKEDTTLSTDDSEEVEEDVEESDEDEEQSALEFSDDAQNIKSRETTDVKPRGGDQRGQKGSATELNSGQATGSEKQSRGENRGGEQKSAEHRGHLANDNSVKSDHKDTQVSEDIVGAESDAAEAPHGDVEESVVDHDVDPADTTVVADSILLDSLQQDSVKYTAKQLRRQARLERRALRDSLKAQERARRDSLRAIEQAYQDSVQKIRDSIDRIKLDTLIAERIARSSRLADEEAARLERVKQKAEQRRHKRIDRAKARAARRGRVYTGEDYTLDTLSTEDSLSVEQRDTAMMGALADTLAVDSLADSTMFEKPFPADSVYKMIKAYRHVKMFRSESQMICDSLVTLNTDSVIRMYIHPVMWNENNQIKSDSAWVYTERQKLTRAHFMGAPIMGVEIDTVCYNQVKGKDMNAYFDNGSVYRYDVDGNAQTLYYMQEEDTPDVTAMMYIESSAISFYLDEGQMDHITFKQNPEYVLYPMSMIPETQTRILDGFEWCGKERPTRLQICDRSKRDSRRESVARLAKPKFPIMERIDYDRRRLVENRMWKDRSEKLPPDIVEWRNSCPSYRNRRR